MDLTADELIENDVQRFYEICNQPFVLRWMDDWKMDLESAKKLIKFFITGYDIRNPEKHPFVIAIRMKQSNDLIGICGFGPKEELGGSAEICYFIDERYSNKGYMKQIIPKAVKYYFDMTQKEFLCALLDENNLSSKKLLLNNGFSFFEFIYDNKMLKSHYRLYRNKFSDRYQK